MGDFFEVYWFAMMSLLGFGLILVLLLWLVHDDDDWSDMLGG